MVDLSTFDRASLGTWPTPLEHCGRLSEALGGPRILLKRDDVNGLGLGGNKLRKLEFLLGAALAEGADTVVTFGGLQTNHGRQTAAACARLGLRCELVLTAAVPLSGEAYERSGNVALDRLYGAQLHFCADEQEAETTHLAILERAAQEGRKVTTVPMGGSNAVGALGYVAAALELHEQAADIDRIVCPTGSVGTVAGLIVGAAALGWPVRVDAVAISEDAAAKQAKIEQLVAETAGLLGLPVPSLDHVRVTDRAVGDGYGLPTPQTWEAIRLFARTEGVLLDPVYTGKAAAGLIAAVAAGEIPADETVVFLHSGGTPALFGYTPDLIVEAER
ncbi:D-cysteine desulfhydrase family protein [Pseudonocardiaceae bacterium YIM PH 21723]|nr:D-cysteine desulfhydrase family protein [Pseudonocardiaceae bacterium YIM PH 21723]